jgi:hypothetical protein
MHELEGHKERKRMNPSVEKKRTKTKGQKY